MSMTDADLADRLPHARPKLRATLTILWATAGFSILLLFGLNKLARAALEAFAMPLAPHHLATLVASAIAMAWFEGYRGFQLSFSPRFAARARELGAAGSFTQVAFAPLVCMGLLWASRRRLITSWSLTVGIVILVVLFRLLPQPWRGILDGGVFVGLGWGLLATWGAVSAVLTQEAPADRAHEPHASTGH